MFVLWLTLGVVFILAWISVDDSKGNGIRLDELWMLEDDAEEER